MQDVDVNDVIQDVIHIVEPEAARRGVVVSADRRRTTLAVRADQVHLQQVMLNLAINGMDAMLHSIPGRRRLAFQTALIGESEVEVSVSDTGTGIPEEKLKNIFESFMTTKAEGPGLGLSIARPRDCRGRPVVCGVEGFMNDVTSKSSSPILAAGSTVLALLLEPV